MPYFILLTLIGLYLVYKLINREKRDEANLMEDVPTINVSTSELQKHAMEISTQYSQVKNTNCRRKLIKSLNISYKKILRTYEYIDRETRNNRETAPATEWLLDNLYIIEKEYKHIKNYMPKSYYTDLPVIYKGIMKGYPRIYHIAVEMVSHTDGIINEKTVKTFIKAYERNTVLKIGELWALPIMIRIALIQNISKITGHMIFSSEEKRRAEIVGDKLINAVNEKRVKEEILRISSENYELTPYFVERLVKLLRNNGVDNTLVYKWINEKLDTQETNIEKMIALEHQQQASIQFSIGNSINSLRAVEAINWREAFEELSLVEEILKEDPARVYAKMDFESKDYYRHCIEEISKNTNKAESYIAKTAVQCARSAISKKEYEGHIGYYIVDEGIEILKKNIGHKDSFFHGLKNKIKKHILGWYIGTILIGTALVIGIFIGTSLRVDKNIQFIRYLIAVIALLIPSSEIVVSILNWGLNHIVKTAFIPKMEFKDGIPEEFSSIVVIPTLLNNEDRVHQLISDIEVYYLANREKNIYFALLGDFKDSDKKEENNDRAIINKALSEIKELNDTYKNGGEDIFYFFNRYRQYNKKENKWIGWERKRGKLVEFNQLLRGNENTSYDVISGDISKLKKVKYVITLDADTQLPRDSAKKLIGAMAHILNRPYYEKNKKRVKRGYGLLQPRISVSTVSANKTLFSKIFSGETGIDTYTTAVSDIYQDLFGEGIFTGKGIYDIDVFNHMLKDEIPENTVLSHDLLEGSYVRAGLVSDIELIDGYPAYYNSSSKRLHRWVRGDWQLIPFLKKKEGVNVLSKWKIIDNLRRSLLAPSIIILILLSLTILPDGSDKWLVAAFLSVIFPLLFDVTETFVSPIKGISLSGKVDSSKMIIEQIFLIFSFLPYQTVLMLDAVIRTLYRVFISKKNLLEWQTAADVEASSGKSLKDYIRSMGAGSIISMGILLLAFYKSSTLLIFMLPSCVIWFFSPYTAYYISKDKKYKVEELRESEILLLRRFGRKTWAYFEDFICEEDNYLAPDNYQEDPKGIVAHRTSPTNMAMGLTSNIVAYDLGYIGMYYLIERIEKILNSMDNLEKYKGHFLNWYSTIDREPLWPKYVSTVDSGNLVGYLWLMTKSLNEYMESPLIEKRNLDGLIDILKIGEEEVEKNSGIKNYYEGIIKEIKGSKIDIILWKKVLLDVWSLQRRIEKGDKKYYWNDKIKDTVTRFLKELQLLLPFTDLIMEEKLNIKDVFSKVSINKLEEEIDKIILNFNNDSEKEQLILLLRKGKEEIRKLILRTDSIIKRMEKMVKDTDFKILYDKDRKLFAIGYDVERGSIGDNYYDLLASEARQASFVAIAKGDVEKDHWFRLGRAMTVINRTKALVSWSGTMFEYFMPLLIMKSYPETLLNETYKAVVDGQIAYAKEKRVPFGISESAFYKFDVALNYQYKAFGVPGIGLKRGLANELVVSPYSTFLALQIDVKSGISNLRRLAGEGLEGRYGFYEAIDFTKGRVDKNKKRAKVKCFMVHHEGMSLMALDNVLNKNVLQNRFHSIPKVKATELLLQEKVPKAIVYDREQNFQSAELNIDKQKIIGRSFKTAKTAMPETLILSNGSYSLMITNRGSGYSKKEDTMCYRWKEDVTLDNHGMFFYIKDIKEDKYWSATYEPCKDEGDSYSVLFSLDKAEFKRRDKDIRTETQVCVSNEDDVEIRKITITNDGEESKIIEITSYLEVTLTRYNADIVHPAFSNLFIKTEFVDNPSCIIAKRRVRKKGEPKNYLMQTAIVEGKTVGTIQYETSRVNFIGRNRTVQNPIAIENISPLLNNTGAVLDPIISIRRRIKLKGKETASITYITGITDSKEKAVEIARKYSEIQNIKRVFELAFNQAQVELRYLGIKSSQANLYQLMASKILYLNNSFWKREAYIKNINRDQSCLWCYGISGDLPIVLVTIKDKKNIDFVKQILNAHEYWSIKGIKVDLIVLSLEETSYMQETMDSLRDLIHQTSRKDKENKSGGIFLHSRATMAKEDINLMHAISRLVLNADDDLLVNQVKGSRRLNHKLQLIEKKEKKYREIPLILDRDKLLFYNGIGGFNDENKSYVIELKNGSNTPAPWINVISNRDFGFLVSENGVGYSWYKNSRENKLTPWSNDWVTDTANEGLYIRDEETLSLWSISPKPIREEGNYIIEHGFGYSNFKHNSNGIEGEITQFVPIKDTAKIVIVTLKNSSGERRRLSLTYYAQTVLGVVPEQTNQFIYTIINDSDKYICGRNPYSKHFGDSYSYLSILGGEEESFSGDRKSFIGNGGNIEAPDGLKYVTLPNNAGAGFDPCIAENSKITLEVGEEKQLIILLGAEEGLDKIEEVVNKYRDFKKVFNELKRVKDYWRDITETIKVSTPDKTMDIMLNGWLLYQTLSCRVWARSAFYQSGGAYGFRDQLQDVMSLSLIEPKLTRDQILYSASRQYVEGDVQHWWHPVINSGIRTRFSDDLLWLPYVTAEYVEATGDYEIFDEMISFLQDEPLKEGEDERYNIVNNIASEGTLFDHCIKAIERSLKFGEHNIPLMGSGDWNDGMSTVGNKGKGESVWLGWFLFSILDKFILICERRGELDLKNKYSETKEFLRENLLKSAWDGKWYRRAYFDDGTPLGSVLNDECRIDSLSQSWSVISGATDMEKGKIAMESVKKYLIKEDKGMVLLLSPPFNNSSLEPGYIKGYVPGVRENGGQYTHAAIWVILAFTKLQDGDEASKLFNMINPINHTQSFIECENYKVEPYVMAADVYGKDPHKGRGGWTWYTGAAGWLYKVGIEGILGLKLKEGKGFSIKPCIPASWDGYSLTYKKDNSQYNIKVIKGDNKGITLDRKNIEGDIIPFLNEGTHEVIVTI